MFIEEFLKFASDFSLFPDIMTKPKLISYFNTLSNVFASTLN